MDRSFVRGMLATARGSSIAMAGVAIASIAGIVIWCTRTSMSDCESEQRFGGQERAVDTCRKSYEQTRDDRDLVWAARAYLSLSKLDEAEELARRLLSGSRYGDAHQILSYVALRDPSSGAAKAHAVLAYVAYRFAGDAQGLARAALSLSQAAWRTGDFTAALYAADDALTWVSKLHDPHLQVVAHVARADALRRMGDVRGATDALTPAIAIATQPCDKAWARVKNGMCLAEAGEESLAMAELNTAAQENRSCHSEDISSQVMINQAWLLRRKDPSTALAKLDALSRTEGDLVTSLLLRGYLAADRGALAEAADYLARAARGEPPDADWPWEITRARAELSELRGGLLGDLLAEQYYRHAMTMVAALRATARARSAYLVSSHRGPYEGLIALLARKGRWRDVLAVILDLDASDMLRATADEGAARDRARFYVATPASSSTAAPPTVDDVLAAWHARDLVIVIAPSPRQIGSGREPVYRLRISEGRITGEAVAEASMARRWADALFADPGDRAAATSLGRVIVPPDRSDRTLHVLAIGSLGKVPLAALRDEDGAVIIGKRPLVRVLALRARLPEARGAGPAVVLADPRGDLPSAAREGTMVVSALGPGAWVMGSGRSAPATRARLWEAHDAAVVHVAGHVGESGRWRALRLADGDVEPAEMVQHGLAPRIAVLAGCGSAAAMDEEGWGSIAAALLESGTAVVIATDRSVGDAASLALMSAFYAQPDWRADPARALARVQHAQEVRSATSSDDATKARSWAAFSVLARPPVVAARAAE